MVKRISSVDYKLALPADFNIYHVFHVSMLKRYQGSVINPTYFPLPPKSFSNQPLSLIVAVCVPRHILQRGKAVCQVLVQWYDSSPKNVIRESFENFWYTYPDVHLEDKMIFEGTRNDTTIP